MTRGRFEGQSVFITGGSSGIGAGLGLAFAREGARVALAARDETRLDESVGAIEAEGGTAVAVRCDVCDRASIDGAVARTVDSFGGIDVAIANAGFGVSGTLPRLTTEDFRRQFDTNVFGLIDTTYAVLPHLMKSKGRLGLVSSVLGKLSRPAMSAYASSKFAVCGFAESIYYELAPLGVAVTCINPGLVQSSFRIVDNQGALHAERDDPAPQWLVVPTERAAREIVNAMYRRKFEANITGHAKLAIAAHAHFPRLFRTFARLAMRKRRKRYEAEFLDLAPKD